MRGSQPKPPELRQRRNKASTRRKLTVAVEAARAPYLPRRGSQGWHPLTRAWWRDVWRSPMAAEYLEADIHGLYLLADLIDRYWKNPCTTLAGEIRQQRLAFGLTPIDRRRLQWEMGKDEMVVRLPGRDTSVADGVDPRELLRAVK